MSSVERPQGQHKKFWQATSRYGLIHTAKQHNLSNPSSRCLVVYVHGLFGDAGSTWGEMPRWVLENACLDLDVISFSYPSKVWQRSSIAQAAYHLHTWLETEYVGCRNVIFVTHSTGGLVVKHLLNQGFPSLDQQNEHHGFDYASSSSIWMRTRRVINIAVPHWGGTLAMTILTSVVYPLFYCLSAPLLLLTKVLTQGGKDWGKNRIITGLSWKNRWLRQLDIQFSTHLEKSKGMGFPAPLVDEICAESDQSVATLKYRSIEQVYVRGTHKSVKIPNRSNAPIVGLVANIIGKYPTDVSLAIVDQSLARIDKVNKAASISSLIGIGQMNESEPGGEMQAVPLDCISGSQQAVCHFVKESVSKCGDGLKQRLIIGATGVGKSAVMRALAWDFGCSYLSDPAKHPLPLFVPLQQATILTQSTKAYSWESMWAWWLEWAHTLIPHEATIFPWLEQKFKNDAVVVLIDGVDDLLVNHPEIGFSTFIDALNEAAVRYAANARFTVILSLRKDIHGLRNLVRDPRAIFEILPLSRQQAIRKFPNASGWLSSVRDSPVLEQILTPLVLSHYQPAVGKQPLSPAITQTSILSEVIESFLMRSGLMSIRTEDDCLVELDQLIAALEVIAWLFFYKSRGDISIGQVAQEAGALEARWRMNVGKGLQAKDGTCLAAGCRLLENVQVCNTLLKRTVFISTGPDRFRFVHRSWQELLVARFFVDAIRDHWFDELANAKLYSGIYRIAGELYQGESLTEGQVKTALDVWRRTDHRYITGNLIGFLSWTTTPVDTQAIPRLLNELENLDALSRIILIGGLGYRLLVDDKTDSARSDLRRYLLPKLNELSSLDTGLLEDPVASNLAWCYQKAFAALFGAKQPLGSSPNLGFDEEHTLKALPMISDTSDDIVSLDDQSRTLQRALLTPVLDTFSHPKFVIRAVHYLYYLVAAKQHNVLDHAASQELALLLLPGCDFEHIVRSFDPVPELQELYDRCQTVYERLENSW